MENEVEQAADGEYPAQLIPCSGLIGNVAVA
jgi:hypothetical protein